MFNDISKAIYILLIPLVSSGVLVTRDENSPIVYNLKYSKHCHASIWTTQACQDYSKTFPLLNFTNYGGTLNDFIHKYPVVIIETSGEAITPDGRKCVPGFGNVTFDTTTFDNLVYNDELICDVEPGLVIYGYFIQIGIGFTNDGHTLYIRPFINGQIDTYSEKKLDYGLNVTKVIFVPRAPKEYSVRLITNNVE